MRDTERAHDAAPGGAAATGITVDEAEALWALVRTVRQAAAVVRRLRCRADWVYEGSYGYSRHPMWVSGWQFMHRGADAGLYLFEVERDVRTGQELARLVDATPRALGSAAAVGPTEGAG